MNSAKTQAKEIEGFLIKKYSKICKRPTIVCGTDGSEEDEV